MASAARPQASRVYGDRSPGGQRASAVTRVGGAAPALLRVDAAARRDQNEAERGHVPPLLGGVDASGSRRVLRGALANATLDRIHCPPAENHPTPHRMNASGDGIHCPPGETHPI